MNERALLVPVALSLAAALFGAAAQLLYKRAATNIFEIAPWLNLPLWGGLFFFTLVLILLIAAFRNGGGLMVVYPVYATTYIWSLIFAWHFENERVSWPQLLGTMLVLIGVALIGAGRAT
jgi:drug/metabolite transporter (DMT)-like permease